MEHLFQAWPEFTGALKQADRLLFLSDFDGTLTPIVSRPQDAVLAPDVRQKLSRLAGRPQVAVGVISGRVMAELKMLVGLDGIYYAGNHGLEIEGPDLSFVHPVEIRARALMRTLTDRLSLRLAGVSGVIVENKGLSLSVHYRMAAESDLPRIQQDFREVTSPLVEQGLIKVSGGKMISEAKPPVDWHKGKAVETIRAGLEKKYGGGRWLTLYLGDDVTDEDAFRALHRPSGWSVFVGEGSAASAADYYLDSPAQVAELLDRLIDLK